MGKARVSMDADNDIARVKWLLLGIVLFLIGGFLSYRELVYLIRGREVQARVVKAYEQEQHGRFGQVTGTKLVIEYAFTDAEGLSRKGDDEVGTDWPLPTSGSVSVTYTPGIDGVSRLTGHGNWIVLVLFGGALIYLAVAGYLFWREVSEAVKDLKPRRKR
jgi:hypothetical protein